MILICYDGSPGAQSAIEHAGGWLVANRPTVWEPFIDVMARSGAGWPLADLQAAHGNVHDRAALTEGIAARCRCRT